MITARKYREPVTLVMQVQEQDEFGKNKAIRKTDVLQTWANVRQTNSNKTEAQTTEAQETAYRFAIRWTCRRFNLIRWQGREYVVNSVNNKNELNRELVVYAQRLE